MIANIRIGTLTRSLSRGLAALVVLTLVAPAARAQLGTNSNQLPTISVGTATAGMPGNSAQVTITLTPPSSDTVTVQYATRDGTAVAGQDYQATTGTLVFAPGVTSQTVQIPVLAGAGSGLYCWLDLSNALNASIGANSTSVQVPINPSATTGPVTVQFSSSMYTVSESAGSALITVTLSASATGTVSVSYSTSNGTATAGTDYTAVSGALSFSSGQTAQTISVPIIDTKTLGGSKTVNLTLSAPSGASLGTPATATLTIMEDDSPPSTSVTVTATGGQFSPDPAPVNTWVEAGLSAKAVRPTAPAPATLSSPLWDWQFAAIQFCVDSANGPWNDGSNLGASYMIVAAPAPAPDSTYDYSAVSLWASFPPINLPINPIAPTTSSPIGAYWQIGYNAQVTYTDTAGDSFQGVGLAQAQGDEYNVTIMRSRGALQPYKPASDDQYSLPGLYMDLKAAVTPAATPIKSYQ